MNKHTKKLDRESVLEALTAACHGNIGIETFEQDITSFLGGIRHRVDQQTEIEIMMLYAYRHFIRADQQF